MDSIAGVPAFVALAGFVPINQMNVGMLFSILTNHSIGRVLPVARYSGIDPENLSFFADRLKHRINIMLSWRPIDSQVNDDVLGQVPGGL